MTRKGGRRNIVHKCRYKLCEYLYFSPMHDQQMRQREKAKIILKLKHMYICISTT